MTTSGGAAPMTAAMTGGAPGGSAEDFLLALLNTTPVVDGVPTDELAGPARGRSWLAGPGGGPRARPGGGRGELDAPGRPGPPPGGRGRTGLGSAGPPSAWPAAAVCQRQLPPVPHRPDQGQHRPLVLDGGLRQPAEGPPPLPAVPARRLAGHAHPAGRWRGAL